MHANKITKIDFLDILFAGRNKEYGAYDLRKTYQKRIFTALVITILIVCSFFVASVISSRFSKKEAVIQMQVRDVSLSEIAKEEPPPPPPPPPPKAPPLPQVELAADGARRSWKITSPPNGTVVGAVSDTREPPLIRAVA